MYCKTLCEGFLSFFLLKQRSLFLNESRQEYPIIRLIKAALPHTTITKLGPYHSQALLS